MLTLDQNQERAVLIHRLINEHIEKTGCDDPNCETCKYGLALGEEEYGVRLTHIDQAFDHGHRIGFADGKLQRDHDIKRAIKEMIDDSDLTPNQIMIVERILKKYTEA